MSKHTPGPWKVDGYNKDIIWGQDNEHIADVRGLGGHLPIEANARLIAAAPTMLEALKEARIYVERAYECAFPDESENHRILADVDAAIKLAEEGE